MCLLCAYYVCESRTRTRAGRLDLCILLLKLRSAPEPVRFFVGTHIYTVRTRAGALRFMYAACQMVKCARTGLLYTTHYDMASVNVKRITYSELFIIKLFLRVRAAIFLVDNLKQKM